LSLRRASDTKGERENHRRQECDGEEGSNDQDAAALGRCEEPAGSAAKVVTPMCAMATDRVHMFGPTRNVAKQLPEVANQFTPRFAV
jgi:hypothetical protein